jgi:rod shape-determining protein MreB and related proteins
MLFSRLSALYSRDMGIDLGTANTLVCVVGEGIVLSEPSVVAVKRGTNEVIDIPGRGKAVGNMAKEMLGKTPGSIQAIRPMRDGVISDFEVTKAMLEYFIQKVHGRSRFMRPQIVISVPSGITQVEKQAVIDSAEMAGARKVYLIGEPKAAALGAGMPITSPIANMIVDIGGGTTEVAVISLGGTVTQSSVRVAGDDMDKAIVDYMKRTYNLLIGEPTAESIKIEIGSAAPLDKELTRVVKGRDLVAGLPRTTHVTSEEIREALSEPAQVIVDAVKRTLETTEPELAADLVDRGIMLAGGGALLRGLDRVIERETGLTVRIADDPLTAVARGTGAVLENLELTKKVLDGSDDLG